MKRFYINRLLVSVVVAIVILIAGPAAAALKLDFEFGPVFFSKNDVRIPNATGTKFSLTDDLSTDASIYFRGRITYVIAKRHSVSFLAAPLRVQPKGTLDRDISFNGQNFTAGNLINARYRFDSYRWTYRFDLVKMERLIFGFGLTAKIRAAAIRLSNASLYSQYDNVGFVPLINLKFAWGFYGKFWLLFEGEGLGSTQGRAEDILFAILYQPTEKFILKLGYRFLEGGANVDDVYNFAFINYISIGTVLTF